jgi:IS1 family transposase
VVACATGPLSEDLIEQAVTTTVERTHQRELHWFSDGWQGYQSILERAYRKRVPTGKRGRPPWVVPETVTLTQTVKHRDEHGRLLSVEIRAALGALIGPAGTVHVERLNGSLRDRLNALTRKTHAFAKRDATWDALVTLQLFDHNFHRPQRALRLPSEDGVHRYRQRSPAMALGLTDHLWSFQELLTSRVPITP